MSEAIRQIEKVYELLEHKNMQIDENRKVARKIDELELWTKKHEKEGVEYGNEFEEINKKITQQLSEINFSINHILCDLDTGYRNKKPHKCPVCDGIGGTKVSGTIDEECHACEGKGIVWG
jgi:hypothetical protein